MLLPRRLSGSPNAAGFSDRRSNLEDRERDESGYAVTDAIRPHHEVLGRPTMLAFLNQGDTVRWTFNGPSNHTVTDASGMGLFESGPKGSGGSFSYRLTTAGTYNYRCAIHLHKGSVKVPIKVSPTSGGLGTTFNVRWASAAPGTGQVFDVQVRRPGATSFVTWKATVTTTGGSFRPDGGSGTYSFRARLRNMNTGKATGYSTVKSISVS